MPDAKNIREAIEELRRNQREKALQRARSAQPEPVSCPDCAMLYRPCPAHRETGIPRTYAPLQDDPEGIS